MNNRSLDVTLVDLLGGVVVLDALGLSVDDWLDLLDDVLRTRYDVSRAAHAMRESTTSHLVDVLANNRGVDGRGVSLVSDGLQVLLLTLRSVAVGMLFRDILSDVSRDLRCDMLVVRVVLLLVAIRWRRDEMISSVWSSPQSKIDDQLTRQAGPSGESRSPPFDGRQWV